MPAAPSHNFLDINTPSVHTISARTRELAELITPPPLPEPPPQLPPLHQCVADFVAAASSALTKQHQRTQVASDNLYACADGLADCATSFTGADGQHADEFRAVDV